MKKNLLFPLIALAMLLGSCASQQSIVYLQDVILNSEVQAIENVEIRFKPDDIVTIQVASRKPELASIFNLSSTSRGGSNNTVIGYTVDPKGYINFPVLGKISVQGFTKIELAENIRQRIIESKLIDDPIVNVEYQNLTFSTIGEVSRPGNYNITKEKTTIFEALSLSGDLTINGVRDRVFLTRRIDNALVSYQVDLRSKDIYQSPAFYIQQNDMIYVEPNKIRANQSTTNGNTVRTASFWMTLASFITSMTLIFIN